MVLLAKVSYNYIVFYVSNTINKRLLFTSFPFRFILATVKSQYNYSRHPNNNVNIDGKLYYRIYRSIGMNYQILNMRIVRLLLLVSMGKFYKKLFMLIMLREYNKIFIFILSVILFADDVSQNRFTQKAMKYETNLHII